MKIDNDSLSIIIPVKNLDGEYVQVYIPDVPEERIEPVVPMLEHIYSEAIRKKYAPNVFIKDYLHYISDAAKIEAGRWASNEDEQKKIIASMKESLNQFLLICFSGASVLTDEMKIIPYAEYLNKISDKKKIELEGYFVFFYAAGRYTDMEEKEIEKNGWGTYLSCTEYMNSLTTSSLDTKTSENTEETEKNE